jgi:2,3-bisphosphoglycerate-dependent phosphoglycerate mutase
MDKVHTNIYLVRHAHSTYTPDELGRPLSEKGKKDAERVTELLKNRKIDVVISSPYLRAIETVEGVAFYHNLPIINMEDFKERRLAKQPVENFETAIYKVWHDEHFSFDGGESNKEAQERGIRALKKVLTEYRGKNIVIGTHGNIMVLIMNDYDSNYDYEFWKQLSMPDIYQLTFDEKKQLMNVTRLWEE